MLKTTDSVDSSEEDFASMRFNILPRFQKLTQIPKELAILPENDSLATNQTSKPQNHNPEQKVDPGCNTIKSDTPGSKKVESRSQNS